MPEPQADAQAELMAEAFGFYADNILTKDHFEAVLDAKLDARFAQQDTKLDRRFAEIDKRFAEQDAKLEKRFTEQDSKFLGCFADQNARFEGRFGKPEKTLVLHTWTLGFLLVTIAVPRVQALLGERVLCIEALVWIALAITQKRLRGVLEWLLLMLVSAHGAVATTHFE